MQLNKYIEHTCLKADATVTDIIKLCHEAEEADFYAVCVNPCYTALAKHLLAHTHVKVVTVVGFPLGASYTIAKVRETEEAVADHADEIDMVLNIGAFKVRQYQMCVDEIRAVVAAADGCPVKVIIETCLLTEEEKRQAVEVVARGGAQFVKTSTGFSKAGATVEDVRLLAAEAAKYDLKVKAAGGIRDYGTALAMVEAGATRLGTSAGCAIVQGERG